METIRGSGADERGSNFSPLDVLASKMALTIAEAALLGLGTERQLRQMIRDGIIAKSVLRTGMGIQRKKVRLLRDVLIEELRIGQ